MIKVNNVTKSFDKFKALDGLSLNVKPGAVYGLIGSNGAGKTTILKIIAGIYKQTSGEVLVMGENIIDNIPVKSKVVFINDDLFFFGAYTIKDMAEYYSKIYPLWSWERFDAMKEIFKIDIRRKVNKLSKGMQKQVAFWLSVSCCPEIMLLDEPVDGLDPIVRRNIWNIIENDIKERNTTVLVSSHNLREMEDLCDYVGVMHGGKMILEKKLDEIKGSAHKIQMAFKDGFPDELKEKLSILRTGKIGSVYTIIVKGNIEEITQTINEYSPAILDNIPLSLEELFIYELGGMGYEFKDIIL